MGTQGHSPGNFKQFFDEHVAVHALLEQIDEAFRRPSSTMEEISGLLGQLGDRLVYHFAFEEEGGYFAEALLHSPQLIAKANALLDQHPKMRTRAQQLKADLQREETSNEQWKMRTAALFYAFRDELLHHEREENILLQEAYHRDMGIND